MLNKLTAKREDELSLFYKHSCPNNGGWCKGGAIPEESRRWGKYSDKPCKYLKKGECNHYDHPKWRW